MLGFVVMNLNYSTCVETFANLSFNICIKETLGSYFKCYVGNIFQTCLYFSMEPNSHVFNEVFKPILDDDESMDVATHSLD